MSRDYAMCSLLKADFHSVQFRGCSYQAFMLLKAAMPFNFSCPEYLSHHRTRKNRVSPVSPAHMNSPLVSAGVLRSLSFEMCEVSHI